MTNMPPHKAKTTIDKVLEIVKESPDLLIAEHCRRDFFVFVQEFWDIVIPDEPVWNWHISYLCSVLQLTFNQVVLNEPKEHDIIINIPPGTTKSTIVTIMFPAWCWIARNPKYSKKDDQTVIGYKLKEFGSHLRFITGSYSSSLSLEHADLSRDIIRSDRYMRFFPGVKIRRDKELKSNFKNNKGGTRYSCSVGGAVTGVHGHIILIDDPLNPKKSVSDKERITANEWMDQTLSTRKVNKEVTVTILIMQRLHEDDCTGHLLNKEGKKVKLIRLPGECSDEVEPTDLKKHYKNGLLDPKRMGASVLTDLKVDLGQYGYAGQVEQRPVPAAGGMFQADEFKIVTSISGKKIKTVRYWDKAATADDGCFSVGVLMSKLTTGQFLISDVVRGQWSSNVRENYIKQTANIDGKVPQIWVEQEPGSGGKESAESTIRNLAGFTIRAHRPSGDKVFRADPYSVQVNAGNVLLMRGDWNRAFIEEHRYFPMGKFKDQIDASAGAFSRLNFGIKKSGAWGRGK